jgi:hypothetical protein
LSYATEKHCPNEEIKAGIGIPNTWRICREKAFIPGRGLRDQSSEWRMQVGRKEKQNARHNNCSRTIKAVMYKSNRNKLYIAS